MSNPDSPPCLCKKTGKCDCAAPCPCPAASSECEPDTKYVTELLNKRPWYCRYHVTLSTISAFVAGFAAGACVSQYGFKK